MILDFPSETKKLASQVADEIRAKYGDRLAEGIYKHLSDKFHYNFGEGLRQGSLIRYPHEIRQEWECIEAAAYTYALAEALGLKPRMFSVKGWEGIDTGHETVDVACNGHRVLIDPLNQMFGPVTYHNDSIQVEENELTEVCYLPCHTPTEMAKEDIIRRMEFYRSDEGALSLLVAGQRIENSYLSNIFAAYDPRQHALEFRGQMTFPFLYSEYYSETTYAGLGEVRRRVHEQGVYERDEWLALQGREPFIVVTMTGNGETSVSYPPFKRRGLRRFLLDRLYGELMDDMYPEFEPGDPKRPFLFDNKEKPLESLEAGMDKAKADSTPAGKRYFSDLRRAYIRFISFRQDSPRIADMVLDQATLKMHVEAAAREQGVDPITVYRRMLRDLGITDLGKRNFGSIMDIRKRFPYAEVNELVGRLFDRGILCW